MLSTMYPLICEVKIYLSYSYNFGTDKPELSLSYNAKQGCELEPHKVHSPTKSVQLPNHVLQKQRRPAVE